MKWVDFRKELEWKPSDSGRQVWALGGPPWEPCAGGSPLIPREAPIMSRKPPKMAKNRPKNSLKSPKNGQKQPKMGQKQPKLAKTWVFQWFFLFYALLTNCSVCRTVPGILIFNHRLQDLLINPVFGAYLAVGTLVFPFDRKNTPFMVRFLLSLAFSV